MGMNRRQLIKLLGYSAPAIAATSAFAADSGPVVAVLVILAGTFAACTTGGFFWRLLVGCAYLIAGLYLLINPKFCLVSLALALNLEDPRCLRRPGTSHPRSGQLRELLRRNATSGHVSLHNPVLNAQECYTKTPK